MSKIKAEFSEHKFKATSKVKMLRWAGNHWNDILYFPKNYQIGLIIEGEGSFLQNDKTLPIVSGQFFLVHPQNLHSGKPNSEIGWAAEVLVLDNDYVFEICEELSDGEYQMPIFEPMVIADAQQNAKLLHFFRKLIATLSDDSESALATETSIFYCIYELLSLASSSKIKYQDFNNYQIAVEKAKNFIENSYKNDFSLDDLADYACLSKFHLLRSFKEQIGFSPNSYQIQLRLNEARKMIFQKKSLTEIALELGFSDQAHFTNTFKKYASGASPKDLRKTAIFYNFEE